MKNTLVLCAISLCVSLSVIGFTIHQRGYRSLPILPDQAHLIFSEDFDKPDALSGFTQGLPDLGHKAGSDKQAAWRISEGALYAESAHNAALWLKTPLPSGDLRISFTATALSKEGDLKCEIFADGENHQSGYILINGGWKNSVRAIARQDEHGEDRHNDHRCSSTPSRQCVTPQQEQEWVIERRGKRIDWYIDGRYTLSYHDAHPLKGRSFGFNNWFAGARFDKLRIYQLPQR